MHAQNSEHFEKFRRCHAYEHAFELKRQGRVRHVGISFHDRADVLENILAAYPQYGRVREAGIPMMVMEPLLGGKLARLSRKALAVLQEELPDI